MVQSAARIGRVDVMLLYPVQCRDEGGGRHVYTLRHRETDRQREGDREKHTQIPHTSKILSSG